jgi:hypothetical protein
MTETKKNTRPAPPGAISGARALALVLVGLAIGVLGTVVTMTASTRHATYANGLMAVLQAELGRLRQQARHGTRCTLAEGERARSRLALMSSDIPRAFARGGSAMREMSDELLAVTTTPLTDCAALPARITAIDQACDACHSQFR